jgi:hypothetical protein
LEITSRAEALERGLTYYFTGKPCVNGHVSKRNTKNRCCYVCVSLARDAWSNANKEKCREYSKRFRLNSPEKRQVISARWKARNPDKVNAQCAKRRASKHSATPPWLTNAHLNQITSYYTYAKLRERLTSVEHHVDHIVPILGKSVCGLHVPWNLQVITATENLRKNNRFN